ncbi:ABC transporter permease [Pseudomonas oryzihabitans]|uniref:Diguanylate cyclase n=1 Tax=Pseudomonas oryzihabitans TaxID=47885 RepID=A0A2Z5ABY2_9PSED|nr:ABC transporter permease [Pseudomonas oryzihabitans]AXA67456.1 diguanylate cyclase [Pseudomonas oryzihabitans]
MNALTLPHPATLRPARSPFWREFSANRGALLGAVLILTFALAALLAPWLAPFDPLKTSFLAVRKAPSALNWLGTDELGRDLLSRLLWGARSSLLAGVVSVAIALLVGVPLGLVAGYFGGWLDALISRLVEALLSCPFLVLAIALGAFLGPSLGNAMIAIGLSAMPVFARLTRGQVLAIRHEDYLEGARAIGLPDRWILWRYVLPNILSPLVVQATLTIAAAILAEASLSFLGLGQQPPMPSWGSMLNTAKNFMEQAPWMSIAPGVCIYLTVLGFNLLGDGLRDALDPRHQ